MISALKDFVPVTGNTHDLQNRRSELGEWFLSTVSKVNPRVDDGQTSQGFYVVAADGTAFGFNNNRSVERVLSFMADGLKSYRTTPMKPPAVTSLGHRKVEPPLGATVLRVYSRILPVPEDCGESNKNLQRDHFWILEDEARSLAAGTVPESMRLRLLRFALVDAVRGEPDFWTAAQIGKSEFTADASGGAVRVHGEFSMSSDSQSLAGSLDIEIEIGKGKITALKGYADCTASGSGTWTPGAPTGFFPLKFAFVLAPATIDTVPPQAAMFGREYLAGR